MKSELIEFRAQRGILQDKDTETEEMRIHRERVDAAIELRENKHARLLSELQDVNTDISSL